MANSKVKKIGDQLRPEMIAFNRTNASDEYNESHPDAISDGDNYGKNQLGAKIDIETRENNIAKNIYTPSNEYRVDD